MNNLKDFLQRLQSDEEFAAEVNAACRSKQEAGGQTAQEILIPAAKEFGYEISEEELKEVLKDSVSELSEEEMGKVSGGTELVALSITLTAAIGTYTYSVIKDLTK